MSLVSTPVSDLIKTKSKFSLVISHCLPNLSINRTLYALYFTTGQYISCAHAVVIHFAELPVVFSMKYRDG